MKKSYIVLFVAMLFSIVLSSCWNEEFITNPDAALEFSTDTVVFDTIFVTQGSATRRFMVYNPHEKSIRVSEIRLARGDASPFRINVDGKPSALVKDYEILPHDSSYIFIDVTIDPNAAQLPFIEKDSVVFITNGNFQNIKLLAWGQNANFFHNHMITTDTTWTNNLPYVISNHVGIDKDVTLTIQPGVQIYSDNGSAILVWGTIKAEGSYEEPVIFQHLRLDEYYNNIPGQWYGLYFLRNSKDNYLKNVQIRNATIGVRVDSLPVTGNPNLVLENVRIENMSAVGILGYSAHITAYNTVVSNCCQYLAVGDLGGEYKFYHCTFSHSTCVCSSQDPALAFYNTDYNGNPNDMTLMIVNSIVWGYNKDELDLKATGQGTYTLAIDHSLLKTTDSKFDINGNILNQDPKFINECKYNFRLDTMSPAINKGIDVSGLPLQVKNDFNGKNRSSGIPDLGAYERDE